MIKDLINMEKISKKFYKTLDLQKVLQKNKLPEKLKKRIIQKIELEFNYDKMGLFKRIQLIKSLKNLSEFSRIVKFNLKNPYNISFTRKNEIAINTYHESEQGRIEVWNRMIFHANGKITLEFKRINIPIFNHYYICLTKSFDNLDPLLIVNLIGMNFEMHDSKNGN